MKRKKIRKRNLGRKKWREDKKKKKKNGKWKTNSENYNK